ncbi:hypothetical protein MHYP_G00017290 [Metynnis hypsauchen]
MNLKSDPSSDHRPASGVETMKTEGETILRTHLYYCSAVRSLPLLDPQRYCTEPLLQIYLSSGLWKDKRLARALSAVLPLKAKRDRSERFTVSDPVSALTRAAVGARVWLYNPQRKKGLCPKLQSAWVGPCSVLSRLGEVVYRIRWGRRTMIVHRDRLAPYRPRLLDTENGSAVPAGPAPELDPNSGSSEPLAGDAVPGPSRPPRARRLPARLNDFVCDTL